MRSLGILVGLLASTAAALAAPVGPTWPEPVATSLKLVEGPDSTGRFRALLRLKARQRVEDLFVELAATPGIELDQHPAGFDGSLAAGQLLEIEARGRVEAGVFPLPPGLSLAVEYRYDPAELRRALAAAAEDRAGVEAYLAAETALRTGGGRVHRVRFLAIAGPRVGAGP